VLERQEYADIPGIGIDGAHERDDQQQPECGQAGEGEAGGCHQQGGAEQQSPMVDLMSPGANRHRCQCGTQQRCGTDQPHRPGAEAQREQVSRQQHGDVAIDKGA
jgi:hypothetical protein